MQADLGWHKKVKLSDVSFKSPKILGQETLASAASVSSSESLWQVVRGLPYDLFAEKAWLDNSLAASGQFKWTELLDYVRISQPLSNYKLHLRYLSHQDNLLGELEMESTGFWPLQNLAQQTED